MRSAVRSKSGALDSAHYSQKENQVNAILRIQLKIRTAQAHQIGAWKLVWLRAGREGKTTKEGFHHEARGRRLGRNPERGDRKKKSLSPGYGAANDLCAAWAETKLYWYEKKVARDFARLAGSAPVKELHKGQLEMLVNNWKMTLAPNTVSNLRHTTRRLLAYLIEHGAPAGLLRELPRVPPYQASQRVLSQDEQKRLIENAAPWLQCFLLLMLTCGLRSGEARRAAPAHYAPKTDDGPKLRGFRIKNRKEHMVSVHPSLKELLDTAGPPSESARPFIEILKGQPEGQPLKWSNLVWHFKQLKKKAGIDRRVRMHHLRHTAATDYYMRSGRDLRSTQIFLGHSSAATTAHYLGEHIISAEQAAVIRKMVPFLKPTAWRKEQAG